MMLALCKSILGKIVSKVWGSRFGVILILLAALTIWGLLVVDDYGRSWDEYTNYDAGMRALRSYRINNFLKDQGEEYYHGTFYFMIYAILPKVITTLNSSWNKTDLGHFTNYFTFLLATYSFYSLTLRLFGKKEALIATVLFISQPLFLGHAFISQKDSPFFAFFLTSISLGVAAASQKNWEAKIDDQNHHDFSPGNLKKVSRLMKQEWVGTRVRNQVAFIISSVGVLILSFELIIPLIIYPFLEGIVSDAYQKRSFLFVNNLFHLVAEDAWKTPLSMYFEKLQMGYFWILLFVILLLLFLSLNLLKVIFPITYRTHLHPLSREINPLLLAGAMLGMTASMRLFGPFAGLLVSLYLVLKRKRQALIPLVVYWSIAAMVMYLTWPALWGAPFDQFGARVFESMHFEIQGVLFEGHIYPSDQLPYYYLPKLLTMQLTEPVLLALPIGVYFAVRGFLRNQLDRGLILIMLLWFIIPLITQVSLRTPIYNNFRHLLFITPPLLLLGGYGCARITDAISFRFLRILVVIGLLIPTVIHIINFHPYEYVYYNQITGGVRGAVGRYELDYACTSLREAVEWINLVASPGDKILLHGPDVNSMTFGRDDIVFTPDWKPVENPEFALACEKVYPHHSHTDMEMVFELKRGEAIFATVLQRKSDR